MVEVFHIQGGIPLYGNIELVGSKNVALKILIASLLTESELNIYNVPLIGDVKMLCKLLRSLGVRIKRDGRLLHIKSGVLKKIQVPLDVGARIRSSSLVLGPMLARYGEAVIPNPGGCRLGSRPINRLIEGLEKMGAVIRYNSNDGYFYAHAKKLNGTTVIFNKNSHTGTEGLILAAVLAEGETVLKNAAEEVEVDDLIALLNKMGARVKRTKPREIVISGVKKLNGAEHNIIPDRNEEVTFAVASAATRGDITVQHTQRNVLHSFIEKYKQAGGGYEEKDNDHTRYYYKGPLKATHIITQPHPGFMTDWQAPWAVLMTQAKGRSTIHETIFEQRFSYVKELCKMGAKITYFCPKVKRPESLYNFNCSKDYEFHRQAIEITGPTELHNAVLDIHDLRAGATLVIAALSAKGMSFVYGVEQIDRGYEAIELRLSKLGARIKRTKGEPV